MPAVIPLKVAQLSSTAGELREFGAGDFLSLLLGGTGATNPADARANLGLGTAAIAALVGPVTLGGGATIQSGTNANGSWWRWPDGLQITTKTLATSSGSTTPSGRSFAGVSTNAGALPSNYLSTPTVVAYGTDSRGGGWAAMDIYPTDTTWGAYSTRNTISGGTTGVIYLVGIGRWA